MTLNIGILSIQGDIAEHISSITNSLRSLSYQGTIYKINNSDNLSMIDGLIIPGGESTVIGKLISSDNLLQKIKDKIISGMPVFGICAGLILLSKHITDRIIGKTNQHTLDLLDIEIERNHFGRQYSSFESDILLDLDKQIHFNGVFIRAPRITNTGNNVKIISKFDNSPIAVLQNNILATTFHPELTYDLSLYTYFINIIKNKQSMTTN